MSKRNQRGKYFAIIFTTGLNYFHVVLLEYPKVMTDQIHTKVKERKEHFSCMQVG
jgi:hypothetical protein